jgi:arylsulfatase A-like enzyme
MLNCDRSGYGIGQGSHVSLSAFDMHNTLIAAGPDFRAGMISDLASGNVDIAPTILSLLGIQPPKPMDGRVLTEALLANQTSLPTSKSRHLEAAAVQGSIHWHQYLDLTEVNGVTYYDEGNGFQTRE